MVKLKKTPLHHLYQEYGAKTVDFGGWDLPVQFSSIKKEHQAVREHAGLFDVSHMGEISVCGNDSLEFLQKVMTNDVSRLNRNQVQYTAMCYQDGGTVDDLLIYKKSDKEYLLVVNAANIENDFNWLSSHLFGDVLVEDHSEEIAQLALQGPKSEAFLQTLVDVHLGEIRPFTFLNNVVISGVSSLVSRTGYTGEDGFEIYCSAQEVDQVWRAIMETGQKEELLPCGLGARDTLRFEANLALYGQELSSKITPIEAGIGFAVKTTKEDFIGRSVLEFQKLNGPPRILVGIEMIDKGIPRSGYPVFLNGEKIGYVTTGTQSPTLKKNIGLALLESKHSDSGTEVTVEIRKKQLKARIVETPFYRRQKK